MFVAVRAVPFFMVNSLFLPPVWEVWSDAEYPSARTPPELGDCQDAGRRSQGDSGYLTWPWL